MPINRTTLALSLDKRLEAQVRAEAARQRRPLCRVAEELLQVGLKDAARKRGRRSHAISSSQVLP